MNDKLNTALHKAIVKEDPAKVKQLLEAGADANAPNKHARTPFQSACWEGQALIAQMLLEHGAKLHTPPIPLSGLSEEKRRICEEDRCIYTHPVKGVSALRVAAWQGMVDVVQVLLARGADPEDVQGALRAAFWDNGANTAPLLIEAGATMGLVEYVMIGDSNKVAELLDDPDACLDVNAEDLPSVWSPYVVLETTAEGIEVPAKIDLLSSYSRALEFSYRYDRERYQQLTDRIRERFGWPALDRRMAADNARTEALQKEALQQAEEMIRSGASLDTPNEVGWTPLLSAVIHQRLSVVRLLLEHGAAVHAPGPFADERWEPAYKLGGSSRPRLFVHASKGLSLLRVAAWGGNESIVKALLARGADPIDVQWALRCALVADDWNADVIPLLLEAGATLGLVEYAMLGDVAKVAELLGSPVPAFGSVDEVATTIWLAKRSNAAKETERQQIIAYLREWTREHE